MTAENNLNDAQGLASLSEFHPAHRRQIFPVLASNPLQDATSSPQMRFVVSSWRGTRGTLPIPRSTLAAEDEETGGSLSDDAFDPEMPALQDMTPPSSSSGDHVDSEYRRTRSDYSSKSRIYCLCLLLSRGELLQAVSLANRISFWPIVRILPVVDELRNTHPGELISDVGNQLQKALIIALISRICLAHVSHIEGWLRGINDGVLSLDALYDTTLEAFGVYRYRASLLLGIDIPAEAMTMAASNGWTPQQVYEHILLHAQYPTTSHTDTDWILPDPSATQASRFAMMRTCPFGRVVIPIEDTVHVDSTPVLLSTLMLMRAHV